MTECETCIKKCSTLTSCSNCSYKSCKVCVGKFLCASINEPRCMNCKHPFSREFLIESMGMHWYDNKYKNTRKEVLFDREQTLFSDTLEFAEQYRNIDIIHKNIRQATIEFGQKREEFMQYKLKFDRYICQMYNTIGSLTRGVIPPVEHIPTVEKTIIRTKIYQKCPVKDCVGMVNNENVCIACNANVCATCCEVKDSEHVCDPNTIETMKMLKKDTKNCPKCATPIHRSSGCYQMWCTYCHTTFHYRTLEILNENIHNPHYVDWLRNNTEIHQQPDGGNCRELTHRTFNVFKETNHPLYVSCSNIMTHVFHLNATTLRAARDQLRIYTNEETKRLNRTHFMLGKLDEKKYKVLLFKSYKQTQRWSDVIDLVTMYITTLKTILANVLITQNINTLMHEMTTLCDYVLTQKNRINKIYDNRSEFKINLRIQNGIIFI